MLDRLSQALWLGHSTPLIGDSIGIDIGSRSACPFTM